MTPEEIIAYQNEQLLNRLTACRQTTEIGKEWNAHSSVMHQQEVSYLTSENERLSAEIERLKKELNKDFQEKHAHFLVLKAYNALNDFVSYACVNSVLNESIKQAQEIRDTISAFAHTIEKSIER